MRWPGVTLPGTTNGTIVISPDFYPTLLEMAGLKLLPQQHVDGRSFASHLRYGSTVTHGPVFWHYPHYSNQGGRPFGAVREGACKLIEHYEDMRIELFDLATDPGETTDISLREPQRADSLRTLLLAWRKQVNARMPLRKADRSFSSGRK